MEKTRRHFTPQQKVAILREHLVEHVPVSDLCDKHKLHPTVFYQWQKAFFENGTTAFESRRPRSQSLSEEEDKIAALETKLRNKTEVLAEVVEELVRRKKSLGRAERTLDCPRRLFARNRSLGTAREHDWLLASSNTTTPCAFTRRLATSPQLTNLPVEKRPSLPLATKKSSRPEKPVKPNATKTTPTH
jgi:transposase